LEGTFYYPTGQKIFEQPQDNFSSKRYN